MLAPKEIRGSKAPRSNNMETISDEKITFEFAFRSFASIS
jgi:hypothetical protein